jgi:uncharacterized protein YcbK (DUF882 family)
MRTTVRIWSLLLGVAIAAPVQADAPTPNVTSSTKRKSKKRRHAHAARFSGRLASQTELRETVPERASGHLSMFAVNLRESVDVDIYNSDGTFNEDALDQLNHIFRCKRTDTEKAIDPHLFEVLSRIYDHFRQRLELVSGFRNQERVTSFHFHGSASDIRIPGVPEKVLHAFVTQLDSGGMGIGLYPRAGFIHVDIRPEASYRWVDYSPPGTENMGHPKHSKKKKARLNS